MGAFQELQSECMCMFVKKLEDMLLDLEKEKHKRGSVSHLGSEKATDEDTGEMISVTDLREWQGTGHTICINSTLEMPEASPKQDKELSEGLLVHNDEAVPFNKCIFYKNKGDCSVPELFIDEVEAERLGEDLECPDTAGDATMPEAPRKALPYGSVLPFMDEEPHKPTKALLFHAPCDEAIREHRFEAGEDRAPESETSTQEARARAYVLCPETHAVLINVLSKGSVEDDERFVGILENTILRFENFENEDFLKLSVQFRLAKRYVEDIISLKKEMAQYCIN